MTFSLLIANYNGSHFLPETIDSVLKQTYTDFEIVVVDDSSTDKSFEILQQWKETDSRVSLYKNEANQGSARTKRKCIELANGQICGFLDSDDIISPDAIEVMVSQHREKKNVSLIYSNFSLFHDSIDKAEKYSYNSQIPQEMVLMVGITPNHFSTFKKDFYLQTSGISPDVMPAEDRDLVLKLEEVGDVLHIQNYLYFYRLHENSISNNSNAYKAEYWAWECRYAACERRGLDKVEVYKKVKLYSQQPHFNAKETIDYRLGKAILTPFRFIKHILKL